MTTIDQPRVFWPGDALPMGAWVMGSDEKPWQVWCPGATVNVDQSEPLVEVPVPGYAQTVRDAWMRTRPADVPAVTVGQVWTPREPWSHRSVRVMSVDRALVRTEGIGQTTVFHLLRHYRLASA